MKFDNATVFITGANRGIGLVFAREALARGARKVYAGARDPASIKLPGVVPVRIDVTNEEQVRAAAQLAGDATIVINNAGVGEVGAFLDEDAIERARRQMEVNYFGMMRVTRAFAPILGANGGGALINVLSIASWINGPLLGSYSATKSAAWGMTNGVRTELAGQKTQVLGLHMGFVDTDLIRALDVPKSTPEAIVKAAYDALERGDSQVLADEPTRQVHASLSTAQAAYLHPVEM
jgi:NAD(P)-dependent dehydrogenase (short-subunit alcohol dehydrogenase family)